MSGKTKKLVNERYERYINRFCKRRILVCEQIVSQTEKKDDDFFHSQEDAKTEEKNIIQCLIF